MGEEEDLRGGEDEAAGEVPAEEFLEGLGAVLGLPDFCSFPWGHVRI
jgi:hypothetical protein